MILEFELVGIKNIQNQRQYKRITSQNGQQQGMGDHCVVLYVLYEYVFSQYSIVSSAKQQQQKQQQQRQ